MTGRYDRQIRFSAVGSIGQARLSATTIAVVGAGGLGCPALLYLAAAGIGHLRVIDHDHVEISNLHRQILFTTADQGRPKAQAAVDHLAALNPDITLTPIISRLTAENADSLLTGADVIIDASDNFMTRYACNDAAARLGRPLVFGAVSGFDGQVAVFEAGHGPCYRCLHPAPPSVPVADCATDGILGPVAGEIGSAMALEAIKLILGPESGLTALRGRLRLHDFASGTTRILSLNQRADCPTCRGLPTESLANPICVIDPAQIDDIGLASLPNAVLIDVRSPEEWAADHRPGAIHLPITDIEADATRARRRLPPDRVWVFYCRSGARARRAISLIGKGYWIL